MNCNSDTIFESEWAAFALPASVDRPPSGIHFTDFESHQLHASLDALDVLGPVLATNATVMLFADPTTDVPDSNSMATPRGTLKCSRATDSTSSRAQMHHPKKASRKQVHELQAMVNVMQVQVNGAAAETQQLAQLVGQFAQQREEERRCAAEEEQPFFEEHEMDMDLSTQQQRLHAQVKQECEQFVCEQHQQQQQWQQECLENELPPSLINF